MTELVDTTQTDIVDQLQSVRPTNLRSFLLSCSDASVLKYREDIMCQIEGILEHYKMLVGACNEELLNRLRDRGARAIPDENFTCELKEQFTPYHYDVDLLAEAKTLLPEDEGAKVIKHVPEQLIPAHHEPGNPRSIASLRDKYKGTKVSDILDSAMQRERLEDKLDINPRQKKVVPI